MAKKTEDYKFLSVQLNKAKQNLYQILMQKWKSHVNLKGLFSLKFWQIKYICYFCPINQNVTICDQIG